MVNNVKMEDMKMGEGRDGALGKSEGGNGRWIQSKYVIKCKNFTKNKKYS